MKLLVVPLLAVALIATPAAAASNEVGPTKRQLASAVKKVRKKETQSCKSALRASVYYRLRHASWHELMGHPMKIRIDAPEGCAHAAWRAKVWKERAEKARTAYYAYVQEIANRTLSDFKVNPGNNAWIRAVQEAQRPYPGTQSWLLSCSSSEGGWGRWVPNSEGSGVGGWMQMFPSTFSTMMHGYYLPSAGRWYEGAWKDLKRRGYIVPRSALSWYSPLGQALASAYGKLNGRGGEWHGANC